MKAFRRLNVFVLGYGLPTTSLIFIRSRSKSGNSEWIIKLDPNANPKRIDITSYPGIYAFEGDRLKIAYNLGGAPPTELSSANGAYYCELVKVKK